MPSGTKRRVSIIPVEIITDEILPKLPAKSLLRFKCVSKSFKALISSSEFIDLQLRQSLSSDANLLLILYDNSDNLYSVDVDLSDSANTAIKIPLPYTLSKCEDCQPDVVSLVGSVNGLLCVGIKLDMPNYDEFKHVLINPSTGVYREISVSCTHMPFSPGGYRVSFGFGFDDINQDYKIVRVLENAIVHDDYLGDWICDREVHVYSLRRNTWKRIERVEEPSDSLEDHQNGVLLNNHLLHWVFRGSSSYQIYCFDVRSDEWANNVPLMDLFGYREAEFYEEEKDKIVYGVTLGVVDGCLCSSTVTNFSRVVWIMKEYGVKESWVKLFEISYTFGPSFFHFYGPFGFRQRTFGFRRGSEILAHELDIPGLFWCDIRSEIYSRTEDVKGIPDCEDACFLKGSLVSIPGGQPIKRSVLSPY